MIFSIFIILYALIQHGSDGFLRGNQRRAASYITSVDMAEAMCFDGEPLMDEIEQARASCAIPSQCLSRSGEINERCLSLTRNALRRTDCSTLQMLLGGCNTALDHRPQSSNAATNRWHEKPVVIHKHNHTKSDVSSRQGHSCVTVDGNPCVDFPMLYGGIDYEGCTYASGTDEPWCWDIYGTWGYCVPPFDGTGTCPVALSNGTGIVPDCTAELGVTCQFPFEFNGVNYTGCTAVDSTDFWCPKGDNLDLAQRSNRANCQPWCPRVINDGSAFPQAADNVIPTTNCSIVPGSEVGSGGEGRCIFPFIYLGQWYQGCTSVDSGDGTLWCPTLLDNYVTDRTTYGSCGDQCTVDDLPDNLCFLKQMTWVTENSTSSQDEFQVENVRTSLDSIEDAVIREGLKNVTMECELPENMEFSIVGDMAGMVDIGILLCIQNRFERFCNLKLEFMLQEMAQS